MKCKFHKIKTVANIADQSSNFWNYNWRCSKSVDIWCRKTHQVSKMCPHKIELVEGNPNNWHTLGSIIAWTYVSPWVSLYHPALLKFVHIHIVVYVENMIIQIWRSTTVDFEYKTQEGGWIVSLPNFRRSGKLLILQPDLGNSSRQICGK